MQKDLSYRDAYSKLEGLVQQLEDDTIQLEQLTDAVKQANELIAICEAKLRDVEKEINEVNEQ